jgi:uncharacterized protein YdcH (DUF465 family)
MNDQRIKEILIQQNETFKNLNLKHQQFDKKLQELLSRNIKTDKEMIEERNLKKQKLKIKDSMQRFIFEYRKGDT